MNPAPICDRGVGPPDAAVFPIAERGASAGMWEPADIT